MQIAELYRARADECERRSQEAHDPMAKDHFASQAGQWLALASKAERLAVRNQEFRNPAWEPRSEAGPAGGI